MADFSTRPSNSPYGSWTNLFFPFATDEKLKNQFKLLNLNRLRVGVLLETLDGLAADTCNLYLRDFPKESANTYFVTAFMDGIHFQSNLESEGDLSINCYPI